MYPIKMKLPADHLAELSEAESGSYEDNAYLANSDDLNDRKEYAENGRFLPTHTHVIAKRHKTILEIRGDEEAVDVYYSVCSGTFGLREKSMAWHRSAVKIANWLRPIVAKADPEMVRAWPTADGY